MSPPVRRRGLKHVKHYFRPTTKRSPPVRRRGLKRASGVAGAPAALVASRAEAWIETPVTCPNNALPRVASRAEAWIETTVSQASSRSSSVASRAEAWIETRPMNTGKLAAITSPPVRRRGLKRGSARHDPAVSGQSPPVRRRGLKLPWRRPRRTSRAVASRAEAWIETGLHKGQSHPRFVASRAEAWIET